MKKEFIILCTCNSLCLPFTYLVLEKFITFKLIVRIVKLDVCFRNVNIILDIIW